MGIIEEYYKASKELKTASKLAYAIILLWRLDNQEPIKESELAEMIGKSYEATRLAIKELEDKNLIKRDTNWLLLA